MASRRVVLIFAGIRTLKQSAALDMSTPGSEHATAIPSSLSDPVNQIQVCS